MPSEIGCSVVLVSLASRYVPKQMGCCTMIRPCFIMLIMSEVHFFEIFHMFCADADPIYPRVCNTRYCPSLYLNASPA